MKRKESRQYDSRPEKVGAPGALRRPLPQNGIGAPKYDSRCFFSICYHCFLISSSIFLFTITRNANASCQTPFQPSPQLLAIRISEVLKCSYFFLFLSAPDDLVTFLSFTLRPVFMSYHKELLLMCVLNSSQWRRTKWLRNGGDVVILISSNARMLFDNQHLLHKKFRFYFCPQSSEDS